MSAYGLQNTVETNGFGLSSTFTYFVLEIKEVMSPRRSHSADRKSRKNGGKLNK